MGSTMSTGSLPNPSRGVSLQGAGRASEPAWALPPPRGLWALSLLNL